LVAIGLISYSLYLWHWPLMVFAAYPTGGLSVPAGRRAFVLLVSFPFAYLSWRFVETPFRKRRVLGSVRSLLAGAGAASIAVAALGASSCSGFAAPTGFSSVALAYAASATDYSVRQRRCIADELDVGTIDHLDDLCSIGRSDAEPRFLLWGDSYANALLPAMEALGDEHEISGYHAVYTACPPILHAVTLHRPRCEEFNGRILSSLRRSRIKHVILAGHWWYYTDRQRNGLDHLVPTGRPTSGSGEPAEPSISSMLVATTLELVADGYHVWLVRETPHFQFDPPRRLALAERYGRVDVVGEPLAEYLVEEREFDRAYLALQGDQVHVIDLSGILCPDGFCRAAADGQSLYSDPHHLSRAGALYVERVFEPLFDHLLD
jgi:hypothetical protein